FLDLQKQVNELEAELRKQRAHYQKRDVDNYLDAKMKDDPMEEQADEEEIICEPKVEREEEEHEDGKIYEPEIDQDDLKIAAMEEKYSAFVGDQASGVVTCIVDDIKEASEDEDVNEVNSYESWDVVFDMSLKDLDDGLHEDRSPSWKSRGLTLRL
ncbi:hypothetical protein P3S38_29095, partial [Enterobacter hormaechei]|uniref:hypothetical protein n=1 Tax=Enterobacter hormaechei TaxID=158836 RepID=UPI0023E439F4